MCLGCLLMNFKSKLDSAKDVPLDSAFRYV